MAHRLRQPDVPARAAPFIEVVRQRIAAYGDAFLTADLAGGEAVDGGLRALGRVWHDGCLRCEVSGAVLREGTFYVHEGRTIAKEARAETAPLCAACGEPALVEMLALVYSALFEPLARTLASARRGSVSAASPSTEKLRSFCTCGRGKKKREGPSSVIPL